MKANQKIKWTKLPSVVRYGKIVAVMIQPEEWERITRLVKEHGNDQGA